MRILLDSCVWGKAAQELRSAGHDVEWVGDWDEDPGDLMILSYANEQERILVTLDKDFGELAIVQQMPHRGIIRLANIAARKQAQTILKLIELHSLMLNKGAILTVDQNRLRIRPSEDKY